MLSFTWTSVCSYTPIIKKKRERNEYCACYIQKLEDNEILFKPKILSYDVNIFFIYGKEYILNIKEKLDSKKQYYKFVFFFTEGGCWLFYFFFFKRK